MEQKVKDKIDKAVVIINDKIDAFNINAEAIKNEVFTEELIKMLNTIVESKISSTYRFDISDGRWFEYDEFGGKVCSSSYPSMYFQFGSNKIKVRNYTEDIIEILETYSRLLSQRNEDLRLFSNNVKDIIEDITKEYREITEKQSDALDNILASLDTEYEPVRHIKVTIEWV